jgi:hypothetical protein
LQFHVLTVLTTLLAVASVVPASLEARNSVNDCGDSTFENQSSNGSPLIVDCQRIASNIAGTFELTVSPSPQSFGAQLVLSNLSPANIHILGGGT